VKECAWPTVQEWIASATNLVEILPVDHDQKTGTLLDAQVTILGSGHAKLPRSLSGWNQGRSAEDGRSRGFWLIADGVVGGFFAPNGGAFGPAADKVFYFAPDTLCWEALGEMGYSEFLVWSFSPNLGKFYELLRWENWQEEISMLRGDQAFSIYPFLWTVDGKDISKCDRRPCPVSEIFSLNTKFLGET